MKGNTFLKHAGGFVILAVVFLLGISVGRDYQATATETASRNQPQASVSIMIDYGDGRVKTYHDISGTTVFDVLKNATDAHSVELKYKDYGSDLGIFVESISGVGKDPSGKKWWQYWVDNTYSQVGVSAYNVGPGDSIQFKFVEGQE
ncbi:MAG TPA: DUF4430 domain-containing protein [Candidatus Paceibacterota bacterium]